MGKVTRIVVSRTTRLTSGRQPWLVFKSGPPSLLPCVFSERQVEALALKYGLDPKNPDQVEWVDGKDFPEDLGRPDRVRSLS